MPRLCLEEGPSLKPAASSQHPVAFGVKSEPVTQFPYNFLHSFGIDPQANVYGLHPLSPFALPPPFLSLPLPSPTPSSSLPLCTLLHHLSSFLPSSLLPPPSFLFPSLLPSSLPPAPTFPPPFLPPPSPCVGISFYSLPCYPYSCFQRPALSGPRVCSVVLDIITDHVRTVGRWKGKARSE